MKIILAITVYVIFYECSAYSQVQEPAQSYKKRVLESVEIDFLSSLYLQDGKNAAVTGGIGSEQLIDAAGAIIISIPLNDDDVLTIDASVSAYSSASSSNINPFDSRKLADPFVASSGASRQDIWSAYALSYSHSSDDRNQIWSAKTSFSTEFDYTSIGGGVGFTRLFNEKNTEISMNANIFIDFWNRIYPIELRTPDSDDIGEDDDDEHFNINNYIITGNANYSPSFTPFNRKGRNSYSAGFVFSQILSKKMHGSVAVDLVNQQGLLSTPYQRVYFVDIEDSFIENFHLADDVERLPNSRNKFASGGRLNYYMNEFLIIKTYYRYYMDDWGIESHTANFEVPIKITDKITLYPSYRFYFQSAADYFSPYNQHLSTSAFYTSDYDLSEYYANQYSFGITYTDIFTKARIWKIGFKSFDIKYAHYARNSSFSANIITAGFKLIVD